MNKKAQSIIEYALIAIVVILGIYFMGSYVLRSINANYKTWDEGVQDSFEENMSQAPLSDLPVIPSNCQCPVVNGSCGSSQGGSFCGANQREMDFACNIQGCNGAGGNATCVNDEACCTQVIYVGCGSAPLDQPTLPANNCYYGSQIGHQECGSNNLTLCNPNACQPTCGSFPVGCCPPPSCLGPIPPGSFPCPNSPGTCASSASVPVPGLTRDQYIPPVVHGVQNCAKPPIPCQYYVNDADCCGVAGGTASGCTSCGCNGANNDVPIPANCGTYHNECCNECAPYC